MNFGTIIGYNGTLVSIGKYNKGWDKIPKEYKTKENFETYCYMNYMGMDALQMFLNKINDNK